MKKFNSISFAFFFVWFLSLNVSAQKVDGSLIKRSIEYLASEELGGRLPGTKGDSLAANYIRAQFIKSGIKLLGDSGFQRFDIITDIKAGPKNDFTYPGIDAILNTDFVPVSFSKNATVQSNPIFVGYGFEIKTDSLQWNDYDSISVKGKWVIILRGEPDLDNPKSKYINYSSDRQKVLLAKDKGAAGVVLVNTVAMNRSDDLMKLHSDPNFADAGLPVINITRNIANQLLKSIGLTIELLEKEYNSQKKAHTFSLPEKLDASADLVLTKVKTYNVIGMIEGSDPVLKNQYVVLGGHFDHLGMGGVGSPSRMPDTVAVHYGADDNASGASGVIALADAYQKMKIKPKRSLIFVTFGAEEEGLFGSKYFVKNPVKDIKSM
ncbi:MAG: M28 family peptidase, partial [Bacteroidota bacterium]